MKAPVPRSQIADIIRAARSWKKLAFQWKAHAEAGRAEVARLDNLLAAPPQPLILPSLDGIPKRMSEREVLDAEHHALAWHENGPCPECLVHLHRFLLEKRWYRQQRFYKPAPAHIKDWWKGRAK